METALTSLLSFVRTTHLELHTGRGEDTQGDLAPSPIHEHLKQSVSAGTERLRAQIRSIAPHYRTALITGERGARKEEVARALHAASTVAKGPFVICNSGWMEVLLQSTDPAQTRVSSEYRSTYKGLARTANGGTIFFPELGLFSLRGQKELLNFLKRLNADGSCRVKVIASVSGDCQALVAEGTLLAELRELIGVVELAVTPLRERLADFAEVTRQIFARIAAQSGEPAIAIAETALAELQRRGWPGNDRELESTLRMAALQSCGQKIEVEHLPPAAHEALSVEDSAPQLHISSMKLQEVIDAHVREVLRCCDGNKLKAAEILGISRSTLYRMLDAAAFAG